MQGSELYEVTVDDRGPGEVAVEGDRERVRRSNLVSRRAPAGQAFVGRDDGSSLHPEKGLFPAPAQIEMRCSCPDWATMCKHVAAVLYGVGARLDTKPDLLFLLRGVDHSELIDGAAAASAPAAVPSATRRLASHELSGVFGIELDTTPRRPARTKSASRRK